MSRPRPGLGAMLAVVAMVAANATLAAPLVRHGGWTLAAVLIGTNALFCGLAGFALRLRLAPMMALFTTAELTEAMLWQASQGRPSGPIAAAAVLGGMFLLAVAWGRREARRARRRRRPPG